MAATNFTPIQLYFSTTASAAPTAANLVQGELAINITDGKLYYEDNGGVVQVIATKGSGTIGGSTTQIQYNNAGALAGNAAMVFDSGTNTTTLTTLNLTNALGAIYGGTAQSTYAQGDIVYASATNTLSKLGIGTVNYILTSSGSVPQWVAPSSIAVLTATNLAGGVAGSVPYQSGVATTTFLAIGTANRVMTSSGTAPQWVTSLTGLTGVSSSSITNTGLTAGRVVISSTAGLESDSANLTFDGTTLSTTGLSNTGFSTLVKTLTLGNSSFNGTAVFAAATPAKLYMGTGTVTDVTSAISATNTTGAIASLAITPIAATNTGVTYTNASTLYIAGAPSAGTNITITNPYSLYVAAGAVNLGGNTAVTGTLSASPSGSTSAVVVGTVSGYGVLFFNGGAASLSTSSGVIGGGGDPNIYLAATTGASAIARIGGSNIGVFSSTGLAVTGTLSVAKATGGDAFTWSAGTKTGFLYGSNGGVGIFAGAASSDTGIGITLASNTTIYSPDQTKTLAVSNTGTAVTGALDVQTTAQAIGSLLSSNVAGGYITLGRTGATALIGSYNAASGGGSTINADALFFRNANGIGFGSGGAAVTMTLDSSGNLGIGVTPSAWVGINGLQVGSVGAVSSSSSAGTVLSYNAYATSAGWAAKYQANGFASIYEQISGTHYWFTAPSGTAGAGISFTQAMTLDSSGNLGIGVAPSAWVSTARAIQLNGFGALLGYSNQVVRLTANCVLGTTDTYGTTAAASFYQQNAGAHSWFNAPSGTAGAGISFTQAMTLDASGSLLINTTTSVGGSARIGVLFEGNASNGINIQDSTTTSNAVFQQFSNSAGTQIGYIGRVTTTNAVVYSTTSDYRLKEVMGPTSGAGARIDALKPIDYQWKDGNQHARGFLAHEFQKVYANSVTGTKDAVDADGKPKYQAMQAATSEVIADLVAEIQSLRARVAQLESKP